MYVLIKYFQIFWLQWQSVLSLGLINGKEKVVLDVFGFGFFTWMLAQKNDGQSQFITVPNLSTFFTKPVKIIIGFKKNYVIKG